MAHYNRAGIYSQTGDYPRAIADYTVAIQHISDEPKKARAHYHRGNNYYQVKDYERAVEDYAESIKATIAKGKKSKAQEMKSLAQKMMK